MKRIIVASTNPVKIQAVLQGFRLMFPVEDCEIEGISVASGVSDQPFGNDETMRGAINRSNAARDAKPGANYWVGIEAGVEMLKSDLIGFAWVVILSNSLIGKSRTGIFILPPAVKELVHQGKELGEADDIVFNMKNSKQDIGAVGILTDNVINRASYYAHAVVLAFIPFKREDLYQV